MNPSRINFLNTNDKKKILLLYVLFHVSFVIFHIALISIFTFFHFLLDHDMGAIENWLNRNSWEILIIAKILSFLLFAKGVILNKYVSKKIRSFFVEKPFYIRSRIILVCIFILTIYYAFILQFGGGIEQNQFKEDLFYYSFIGSILFYFLDFGILRIFFKAYKLHRSQISSFLFPMFIIFFASSKIVLPYLDKYTIFLAVNFISIFYIGLLGRLSDYLVYSFLIIGPFSSFYGIDIVWDNSYSLFTYQKEIPLIGVICIWLIALVYYRHFPNRTTKLM